MECADVEMEGDFKTISLEMRSFVIWKQLRPHKVLLLVFEREQGDGAVKY